MIKISENKNAENTLKKNGQLLTNVLRLQISRPDNFNWKEDYADALEKKYANIH